MKQDFYGLLKAFTCLSAITVSVPVCSADIVWKTQQEAIAGYAGFDDSFTPNWQGHTDRIYYRPPAAYVSAVDLYFRGGRPGFSSYFDMTGRPPIELHAVDRTITTSAGAHVSEYGFDTGEASDQQDRSNRLGAVDEKLHRFARVVNQNNLQLARGNAVSEQLSNVTSATIHATGRIGADTQMYQGLWGRDTSATAKAENALIATYRVNEAIDFQLSGVLSQLNDVDISFSLVDPISGTTLYSVVGEDGAEQAFDLTGTLLPGYYDLSIEATATSQMLPGDLRVSGGLGEYELDFTAFVRGWQVLGDTGPQGLQQLSAVSVPEPASGYWILVAVGLSSFLRPKRPVR